ncbi:MAG: hypothetical protein NT107_03105 [Planctomycetota bacterium]|nr:hypothetical protein [Planctomycetota bacterium]
MTTAGKFVPGERAAYLRTIAPRDLPVEKQLCELLEATLPNKGLKLYAGFPLVVRNSEWLVGFAERGKHPVVYCCSSVVLQAMGKGLALMTSKACLTLRAREGITVEQALTLVARAFLLAKKHGGMISQAAAKQRDKVRNGNNARTAPKKVSSKSADLCTTKPMPTGKRSHRNKEASVVLAVAQPTLRRRRLEKERAKTPQVVSGAAPRRTHAQTHPQQHPTSRAMAASSVRAP